MVAALGDAALDCALKIEPAKFVIAGDARDHAKAQPPPGAASGSHPYPRLQRFVDVGRLVPDGANLLQSGGRRTKLVAIADEREQVLDGTRSAKRVGAWSAEDCHPGTLGHHAPPQLAHRGTYATTPASGRRVARGDLFRRHGLEAGLRVGDINVRG